MSGDLLREAAALMRQRAVAATSDQWAWQAMPHRSRRNCVTVQTRSQKHLAHYCDEPFAEHAAAWHPAVALAAAALLDHAAARIDASVEHGGKPEAVWSRERDAVTLACTYLGRDVP